MAVLMNEAMAREPDLAETVIRETGVMRRQINHHLARARAIGRRAAGHARAEVWPSLEAVARAVSRMHRSEEHTSELQSLMRISYAVFCLKKKKETTHDYTTPIRTK